MTLPAARRRPRVCPNCWERRPVPGFPTCSYCFYNPTRWRANRHWAALLDNSPNPRKAA
jgi:hypothetical protein